MRKAATSILKIYLLLFIVAVLGLLVVFLSFPASLYAGSEMLLDWFPNYGKMIFVLINIARYVLAGSPFAILFWFWYIKKYKPEAYKNILALSISLVFSLVILEIALRVLGFVPGYIGRQIFFHPDKTEVVPETCFLADESGIFAADTSLRKFISSHLTQDSFVTVPKNVCLEVYGLLPAFLQVKNGEVDSPLSRLYQNIKNKTQLSDFENIIYNYVNNPLNKQGFRSIPFSTRVEGKPRILLIGDSFTWGHHLHNISYSFYDRLLAEGLLVYNTGISGADILQYEAIAKKYIPIIQPDIVIVNLFLGNDMEYYPRKFGPFVPLYYPTNAGNIYANQFGVYFDNRDDAYQNVIKNIRINEDVAGNQIADKTVISSLLWSIIFPKMIERKVRQSDTPLYKKNLQNIIHICHQNHVRPVVVVIPTQTGLLLKRAKDFPDFFASVNYFELADLDISDYVQNNGHFNKSGHQKYADYLGKLITSGASSIPEEKR